MISVDASQVRKLSQDLGRAPIRLVPAVRAVVQRGALNVKKDWQSRWQGLAHAPSLAAAVTYDTKLTATGITAEIGPDKARRQGALGNLVEFGSVKNSPIPGGGPALAAEEPRLVAALVAVVGKIL